ncbi:MAG TPA: DinB family protein [Gemmatimonadales bacterium]
MTRKLLLVLASVALAAPLAAQTTAPSGGGAVAGLGAVYGAGKRFLTQAAEQMPEEHYAFKATPEVRSFGQIVGHVANANYMICSMATGETNPKDGTNFEETTAKADLVKALSEAFAYCDKAYQMADAKGMEAMKLFGMDTNRLGVLALNAGHNYEHYGNIVTYMRLKGMTPPSSQRGM